MAIDDFDRGMGVLLGDEETIILTENCLLFPHVLILCVKLCLKVIDLLKE